MVRPTEELFLRKREPPLRYSQHTSIVAPERKKRFPFSMVKSWNTKTTREMTEKMMERIMKACTDLRASVDTGGREQGH